MANTSKELNYIITKVPMHIQASQTCIVRAVSSPATDRVYTNVPVPLTIVFIVSQDFARTYETFSVAFSQYWAHAVAPSISPPHNTYVS